VTNQLLLEKNKLNDYVALKGTPILVPKVQYHEEEKDTTSTLEFS
nr:hypothetical protein [Tanacetum cinerariifolium]